MNPSLTTLITAVLLLSMPLQTACADEARADSNLLVLTNARVYTVNPEQPWATALVIRAGRIEYVGNDAESWITPETRVIDLDGKMVLPGFQDVHAHLASGGVAYTECPLFDLPDRAAILAAIRACVLKRPEATLIRGKGWGIDLFSDENPPTRQMLDAIDDSRPLVFGDSDGHALWLNSAALTAFGITAESPEPAGGKIARQADGVTPRGTVHEDSAMNLVMDHWPAYTDAEIEAGLRWGQAHFLSLGITAIQDAYVKTDGRDQYRSLPAYTSLNRTGELKLRASLALAWQSGGGQALLERMQAIRESSATLNDSGRLQVNMIKFWADGVVETRTAMLLEPYSDQVDTHGLMMIPRNELMEWVPKADAAGFQVHLHAIGDATVRYALDALAAASAANGARDARHHINHLQFVHPDDVPRFKALGVGASFEPYWAYEDTYITHLTRPRVGPDRIRNTYPIRSIVDTGARVAFSSDWSVSSANPLLGIETAITRTDAHSNQGAPFLPEQRISLEQAIAAYTITAAELSHIDALTGSLEPGKYADLIVLDRNLFDIPSSEISDARVLATLIEGQVEYGSIK